MPSIGFYRGQVPLSLPIGFQGVPAKINRNQINFYMVIPVLGLSTQLFVLG